MRAASATIRKDTMPGDLWRRYRDTADPGARRGLLELYLELVHHVAREMSRRTPAAELDDLVSAGTFGLTGALDSFDLTRGLAFSTYAVRRIRGAILDDLRSRDSVPRAVRVKARRLQVATTALERRLGRAPRPEEIAAQLDIDVSTYWRWREDTATRTDAIARLTREERTVMALYYYEELNQRQITEVLHLTEARVSQIRTRALERLR
ncbi:MAG: sigma-70 family RNA polymerase sigma factor [Gemmatimonadales bacterium]